MRPSRPSPFKDLFKDFKFKRGEKEDVILTKWFIEHFDHFNSIEEAVGFVKDKIDKKEYKHKNFTIDWSAIVERLIAVREVRESFDLSTMDAGKLFLETAFLQEDGQLCDESDCVFTFTR